MTEVPPRIQSSRAAGWRKPPDVVIVHRGSGWGNPFRVEDYGRAEAVRLYEAWMRGEGPDRYRAPGRRNRWFDRPARLAELHTLAGRRLACTCEPAELCHADVLARLVVERTTP